MLPLEHWRETTKVEQVEPLAGGYSQNQVWKVEAGQGAYVLKAYAQETEPQIAHTHRLLAQAGRHALPVPSPLVSRDGGTIVRRDGALYTLLPYLSGAKARRDREEHRRAAARMLARLHAAVGGSAPGPAYPALAELNWHANRWWDWDAVRGSLTGALSATVAAHIDETAAFLSGCRGQLPTVAIHGDYWAGNVLMYGDEVAAVIDWDEAHEDWRAYEVANATWQFCRNAAGDALDVAAAREFLRDYAAAGEGLAPAERQALVPLMRARLLLEALQSLALASRGTEGSWEYALETLGALSDLGDLRL